MRKKIMAIALVGSLACAPMAVEAASLNPLKDVQKKIEKVAKMLKLDETGKTLKTLLIAAAIAYGAYRVIKGIDSANRFVKNPKRTLARRYFELKQEMKDTPKIDLLGRAALQTNINFIKLVFPKGDFDTVEDAMKDRLVIEYKDLLDQLAELKNKKWLKRQILVLKKEYIEREIEDIEDAYPGGKEALEEALEPEEEIDIVEEVIV